MLRRRLVVPMFSSKRPPEFAARGVLFGIFFAFTPLVGVQLAVILAFWSFIRAFVPRWDFNLIVAMAWIWTTNVFTLGPIYYGFVLTGQVMLGIRSIPGSAGAPSADCAGGDTRSPGMWQTVCAVMRASALR